MEVPDQETYKTKILESTGLKHLNNSETFIEHLNGMDEIYKNIEECNLNNENKVLIVFGNKIDYIASTHYLLFQNSK